MSWKSSSTRVARVGVGDDVLAEVQLVAQDVVDHAAEERDVGARRGAGRSVSATALVRVNRGSTWMTFAPRALASITHWKPTGWASAMLEPWMTMQSAFGEVLLEVRGAAATERGPQTGDRGGVSNAGLVLDLDRAHAR